MPTLANQQLLVSSSSTLIGAVPTLSGDVQNLGFVQQHTTRTAEISRISRSPVANKQDFGLATTCNSKAKVESENSIQKT